MTVHQPIIVSGVTDTGMRYAQLWDDEFKVLSSLPPAPYCMAWMRTGDSQMFGISSACPPEWVGLALRMFDTFRKGTLPEPTHEQTWTFGRPIHTPIASAPVDGALFTLDEPILGGAS